MKRVYWGLGIIVAFVLCISQFQAVQAGNHSIARKRNITIRWLRVGEPNKNLVVREERKQVKVDEYGYYYFRAEASPGYEVWMWRGDGTVHDKSEKSAMVCVWRDPVIVVYERKIPPKTQTVEYLLRNPETYGLEKIKTETMEVECGAYCEIKVKEPPAYYRFKQIRGLDTDYDGSGTIRYKVTEDKIIRIIWERKKCELNFDGAGGNGHMWRQSLYSNFPVKLSPNQFKRKGYVFDGWKGMIDGKQVTYRDEQKVNVNVTEDGAEFSLYAQWKPLFENMILEYWDLADKRMMECSPEYKVNERILLLENCKKENAVFQGWSVSEKGGEQALLKKSEYDSQELFEIGEAAGSLKKEKENVTLPLYGIWDYAPQITVSGVLIPEGWAKDGKVTFDFLKRFVRVEDTEDGKLELSEEQSSGSGAYVSGYNPEQFRQAKAGDELELWVEAIDKSGNSTKEKLVCRIVDTKKKCLGRKGKIRFINNAYKETLPENSVWRCKKTHWEMLSKVLAK